MVGSADAGDGTGGTLDITKTLSTAALADNSVTDAKIATHTSTKITITTKGQLNSAVVYNDATNVFGDFNQDFKDDKLRIFNPADTFAYTIIGATIGANRNLTLPLLTGNDTVVTAAFIQTITNKTFSLTDNTLTATSAELATAISDETGSGLLVFATSPTLTTPLLGTPTSGVLANCTGYTISNLASGTSANLAGVISDETGTGALVFGTSPIIVTPTIASFTNATHDHSNTAGGNNLTNTALTSGVFPAITGLGVQSQILNVSTFGVQFGEANQDIIGSATGIVYDTPTGDTHVFDIAGVNELKISNTVVNLIGNTLELDVNQTIVPDAGGLTYNVPTGDTHDFQINSVSTFSSSTSLFSINTGLFAHSVTAGITASTTQTQGQGALTTSINEVATVANTNDTVTLPSAIAGLEVVVINNGANSLQIFPASGDDLGQGVDTATTLSGGSNISFFTYDATNWESV